MAKHHNPRISTNGLVFAYDMANTQKSWKGKPTTNHIPNPYASWNGSSFVLGYNYANLGATYTYKTGVSNPVNAPGVMEYFTGTTGYKYFSIDSTAVPTTGNYTFSYYARVLNAASSNLGNSQLWRANGTDRTVTGNWNPTITSDWTKFSTTGPVEAGTILQYFPVHGGSITGGLYVQYCGFQLESGDISTPLVIGTRSNTQSIIDLTGNNTVTVSDLTYAADNTFSFDGSNDYIDIGTGVGNPQQFTCCFWIYATELNKDAGNNYRRIISNSSSANIILIEETGPVSFRIPGHANQNNYTAGAVSLNTWTYISCVYDQTNRSIYQNGNLQGQNAIGAGTVNFGSIRINDPGSQSFKGSLSNVQIYNRALTAAEISQNFNALRGRFGI